MFHDIKSIPQAGRGQNQAASQKPCALSLREPPQPGVHSVDARDPGDSPTIHLSIASLAPRPWGSVPLRMSWECLSELLPSFSSTLYVLLGSFVLLCQLLVSYCENKIVMIVSHFKRGEGKKEMSCIFLVLIGSYIFP